MFCNNFQKEMTLSKSVFQFFNEKLKKYRWKRSAVSTDRYSHKKRKVVYVNSLGNTNQLLFYSSWKDWCFHDFCEVKLSETFLSFKFFTSSIFAETVTILSFIFDSIQPEELNRKKLSKQFWIILQGFLFFL